MRAVRRIGITAACLLFLAAADAGAQVTVGQIASLSPFGDYFDVFDFYSKIPGLFSSYNKCLARGFSSDLCHSVLAYCAINDVPLGGVAGTFISQFQLTQLFKVDCGDGICFACCYVPGQTYPCHSAFHSEDDEPVIN